MPNWNSWMMPVTTPTAKLSRKILPQNFAIFRYTGFLFTAYIVSMMATASASPIETGMKKK